LLLQLSWHLPIEHILCLANRSPLPERFSSVRSTKAQEGQKRHAASIFFASFLGLDFSSLYVLAIKIHYNRAVEEARFALKIQSR
jgi:hypothetical protein